MNYRQHSSWTRPLTVLGALACAVWISGNPAAVEKSQATLQLAFGVKVAIKGSWNEAAFRFEKAAKSESGNARAYNNLAVARENLGQFEAAREAYEKAISLDPDNEKIRENYERFMSFVKSSRTVSGAP